MQNLINQLLQPVTASDGTVKPPNMLHRRAAEAISQLYNQGQQDLQARLALQKLHGFAVLPEDNWMEIMYEDYLHRDTTVSTS